jgi:hypothetical protein
MTNSRNAHIILLPGKNQMKKSFLFLFDRYSSGCEGAMCSLDTFIQLYEEKLPDDMEKECQANKIKRKK